MKNILLIIFLLISGASIGQINPGWFYGSTDGTESDDLKLGYRSSNTTFNYRVRSSYSGGTTILKTNTGAWGTNYYWQRGSSAGTKSIARIGGSESAGHSFVLYSKTDGATGNIVLRSNGDTYFNGGNVGIGYTTPSSKLHVQGQDAAFFSGSVENNLHFGRDNGQKVQMMVNDNHLYFDLVQDADGNSGHVMFFRNLAEGTSENNDIRFQTSGENRLAIKAGGNVGIGTTSPTGDGLTVVGGDSGQDFLTLERPNIGKFRFNSGGYSTRMTIGSNNVDRFTLGWDNSEAGFAISNDIEFATHEHAFFIKNTGNVGIGTTDPDAKLTVKGNIKSKEIKVEVNAGEGPDYVFEEDYNLRSLEETEEYIKAYKHLPEVPSAKVMESEGLNLKEMNLMLLQKIEELTLHMIEQNKEIESLKTEVQNLKSK